MTQLPNHPMDSFFLGERTGSLGVHITTSAVSCFVGTIPAESKVVDVEVMCAVSVTEWGAAGVAVGCQCTWPEWCLLLTGDAAYCHWL